MAVLADFLTKVKQSVQDTADRVDDTATTAFIQQAVKQYGKDRPRLRDAKLTGDGSTQSFTAPAGWVKGFSVVTELEYPIDEVPIRRINLQDNLRVIQRSDAELIQLLIGTLATGEEARILYTTLHTVDASESTVQDTDFDAVCDLAASYLCRALAAFYAEETDSALAVDVVAGASRADTFTTLADQLFKAYKEHMTESDVDSGSLLLHDQDVRLTGGWELLTHDERWR